MKRLFLALYFLVCLLANVPVQAGPDILVPFDIIESGSLSGAQQDKPVLYKLDSQTTWEDFWSKHITITPKSKAKAIDFTRKQVIAVVDSDQPNSGYKLHLDRIEQKNAELLVYVTREQPNPECINMGMVAQPFVIVTVKRFAGPAKLIFNTKNYGCNQ